MFVVIDGPNGVGKTTVSQELANGLRAQGRDVVLLRQPSDSELGRFTRAQERLTGLPLASLVVADRYLQVESEIRPALASGGTVICDRYVPSTLVLQRIDGLFLDDLWEMNAAVLVPDLTAILTATVPTLEARLDRRGRTSRFDHMPGISEIELSYYRDAAEFLRARDYRVVVIDTEDTPASGVAELILNELERLV